MNHPLPANNTLPDDQMLQIWENERIELLHELQEGADADVPDSLIDSIGDLVVILNSWRERTGMQPSSREH